MKYDIKLDEASHIYTVNGIKKPSTSAIMASAGLNEWAKNIHDFFKERGSMIHLATHIYDTDILDLETVDDRIKGYVQGWIKFRNEAKGLVILHSEISVYNPETDSCGTLDRVVSYCDKIMILDIKSNQEPPTAHIQLGNYDKGILATLGLKPDECRCVVLKEDGTYKLTDALNIRKGYKIFKACRVIHNYKTGE